MNTILLVKVTHNENPSLSHEPGSVREFAAREIRTTNGDFQARLVDGSWVLIPVAFIRSISVEVLV